VPETTVPAMVSGHSLRIRLDGHLRGRRVKAYFFLAAFFLAFFFAFAMLALQFDGLVRGPSIYTRIEITSEHLAPLRRAGARKRIARTHGVSVSSPTPSQRRASLERENELPVRGFHWRYGQSITRTQQHHPLELLTSMRAQLLEADHVREAAFQLHIDHEPAWILRVAARIVVMVLAIEGGRVGIAFLHDLHGGDDAGYLGARVIEECLIASPHLISQHVARLVMASAIPAGRAARGGGQIFDTEARGLGLHQPVTHLMTPFSVTTASMS